MSAADETRRERPLAGDTRTEPKSSPSKSPGTTSTPRSSDHSRHHGSPQISQKSHRVNFYAHSNSSQQGADLTLATNSEPRLGRPRSERSHSPRSTTSHIPSRTSSVAGNRQVTEHPRIPSEEEPSPRARIAKERYFDPLAQRKLKIQKPEKDVPGSNESDVRSWNDKGKGSVRSVSPQKQNSKPSALVLPPINAQRESTNTSTQHNLPADQASQNISRVDHVAPSSRHLFYTEAIEQFQSAALSRITVISEIHPGFGNAYVGRKQNAGSHDPLLSGSVAERDNEVELRSFDNDPLNTQSPRMSIGDSSTSGVDVFPPDMTPFSYAMRPLWTDLDDIETRIHSPSSMSSSTSMGFVAHKPLQKDDLTSSTFVIDADSMQDFGIPADVYEKEPFVTRLDSMRLCTYFMRCQVLQIIVFYLQHNDSSWELEPEKRPSECYSRIRKLAGHAMPIAVRLKSRDLQARCWYWSGRGHAGGKDYGTAAEHFKKAIEEDVKDEWVFEHGNKRIRRRGLLQSEKRDVHFLYESANALHDKWMRTNQVAKERAEVEACRTGQLWQDCIEWPTTPPWRPDEEFIMQQVGRRREEVVTFVDGAQDTDHANGNNGQIDTVILEERLKGRLTKEEALYIYQDNGKELKERIEATRWRRANL